MKLKMAKCWYCDALTNILKEKNNNQRGITLIGLIVTIIVIVVLAGVAISLVIGNNGVVDKSSGAIVTNREAKAQEEVEMAWASANSRFMQEWALDTSKELSDYYSNLALLNGFLKDTGRIISSEDNGDGTWTVQYRGNDQGATYTFIMAEDGKVENLLNNTEEPIQPIPGIASINLTFDDLISSSQLKITTNIEYEDELNKPVITEYKYYVYKDDTIVANQTTTESNWTASNLIPLDEYDLIVSVKSSEGNISSSDAIKYKKKVVWDKFNYDTVGDYSYECTSANTTTTFQRGYQLYMCDSVEDCFNSNTGNWESTSRRYFNSVDKLTEGDILIGSFDSYDDQLKYPWVYEIIEYIDHDGSYGEKYSVKLYQSAGTTTYTPTGNSLGKVNSENLTQYPDDGYKSGYYYIKIQ